MCSCLGIAIERRQPEQERCPPRQTRQAAKCRRISHASRRAPCPSRSVLSADGTQSLPVTIDPHQPLRDDVRLLGELLGDTIRTQESEHLLATVERVRALAKSARGGNDSNFRALSDDLSEMPSDEALPIARAFAQFLHLANIAEQHHRVRRRRAYQRDPS